MEKKIRAPASSTATTIFTIDDNEDSQVWREPNVWKVDVEKQEARGGLSKLALWHMDREG